MMRFPLRVPTLRELLLFSGFLLLAAFAAFLRVSDIESRPLHSDEAVNFLFMEGLFRDGIYPYSHENYHGPLYFFAMGLGILFAGDEVIGVRTASIIFGVLTLLPLLPLRRILGWSFVFVAGLLFAVSPSFVFHSRYAIHEMLLIAASLWFATSAFLLWTTFSRAAAGGMMFAAAAMMCTKETWIVTAAAVAFGLLLIGAPLTRLKQVLERRQSLFLGYVCGLFLLLLSFSNGLQNGVGLHEFFLAIPQWIGRGHGDVGHFKAWDYYLKKLIWTAEPGLYFGAGAAVLLCLAQLFLPRISAPSEKAPLRRAYLRFVLGWSVSIIAVYSYIPYKTPWLVINLTLPLLLLTSWALNELLLSPVKLLRAGGILTFSAAFLLSLRNTSIFCYDKHPPIADRTLKVDLHLPYGEGNPFSYVHTSPTMLNLVADLFDYWRVHPEAKVLIGVDGYFPLPYYLRRHAPQLAYLKTKEAQPWKDKYDVIIVDQTVQFPDPAFEKRYYRLSDYGESNTYFRR